jgi:endonuclease/exonuclease/phosphatase family metal-dependent hydrolase
VIFGGDFNATPGQLKEILGPKGLFRDVAQANPAPTFARRKIDYILLDTSHFSRLSSSVTKSAVSDHRLLKGKAVLTV